MLKDRGKNLEMDRTDLKHAEAPRNRINWSVALVVWFMLLGHIKLILSFSSSPRTGFFGPRRPARVPNGWGLGACISIT